MPNKKPTTKPQRKTKRLPSMPLLMTTAMMMAMPVMLLPNMLMIIVPALVKGPEG